MAGLETGRRESLWKLESESTEDCNDVRMPKNALGSLFISELGTCNCSLITVPASTSPIPAPRLSQEYQPSSDQGELLNQTQETA